MEAKVENGVLVIRIPLLTEPRLSASQKNYTVASSGGGQFTDAEVNGKKVKINVSAYINK